MLFIAIILLISSLSAEALFYRGNFCSHSLAPKKQFDQLQHRQISDAQVEVIKKMVSEKDDQEILNAYLKAKKEVVAENIARGIFEPIQKHLIISQIQSLSIGQTILSLKLFESLTLKDDPMPMTACPLVEDRQEIEAQSVVQAVQMVNQIILADYQKALATEFWQANRQLDERTANGLYERRMIFHRGEDQWKRYLMLYEAEALKVYERLVEELS